LIDSTNGLGITLQNIGGTWYGANLNSSYIFTYGYVEEEVKLAPGPGEWEGMWFNGGINGNPQWSQIEIDAPEMYGDDANSGYTVHDWGNGGAGPSSTLGNSLSLSSFSQAFHRYGMLWTSSGITFYIDDQQVWTTGYPSGLVTGPVTILLTNGFGDWLTNASSQQTSTMYVKYVKVWRVIAEQVGHCR
jgi:beta-glucanase (GH16 family)